MNESLMSGHLNSVYLLVDMLDPFFIALCTRLLQQKDGFVLHVLSRHAAMQRSYL